MKYRIHYTFKGENPVDDYKDSVVVEGETLVEIRDAANAELKKRGLDTDRNDAWSEEIK